jgi:hypothetical protein
MRCSLCGRRGDRRFTPLCSSHRAEFAVANYRKAGGKRLLELDSDALRALSDVFRRDWVEAQIHPEVRRVG